MSVLSLIKFKKMKTLYIHIPFCKRKCFYCSFVISVGQMHRADLYIDCLAAEARHYHGEDVQSVYIGGGTPTLLTTGQLKKLFNTIRKHFCVSSNAEWTVEANPEGLSCGKLKLLKEEGVNRISLGVQSLNDKYLKYLGRNHDAATAAKTFDKIRKTGFDNINVDLMFAFPGQTGNELKQDIDAVIRFESEHLSLYTLTVEKRSRFHAKNIQLQDDRCQARHYTMVCDMLSTAGFKQYEISNFAKPLRASKHNLNYWQGGHYIGLGIGAHSYIDRKRFWNISRINDYISRAQQGSSVEEASEELAPFDQMKEMILFRLRMNQGVNIKQTERRFSCFLGEEQKERINDLVEGGFLVRENGYLRASPKGRLVLDELCTQLI